MNSIEAVRGDVARAVRELVVESVDDVIHGATFDGRRLVLAAGYRLLRIMPDSGRLVDQLETFPDRGGLAFDGRDLWQQSEGQLQELDPRTGFVRRSFTLELMATTGLEHIDDDLLVLHSGGRALARIQTLARADTLGATRVSDVEVSVPLRGLAWVGGELWSSTREELCRVDPASGRVETELVLPAGVEVCDLCGDAEGRVWCVDGRSRIVRGFAVSRLR